METVAKKKPRRRRSFTPEFKAEIVEACGRGDRSIGQVARDFDLTETAVREWVKQADIDAGRRDGLTSAEREELAQLRRSPLESTCYVVEVCTACAWNQLIRSFRLGSDPAPST